MTHSTRILPTVVAFIIAGGMALVCVALATLQATRAMRIVVGNGSEWLPYSEVIKSAGADTNVWTDVPGRRRVVTLWDAVSLDGKAVVIAATPNTNIGDGWIKLSSASSQDLSEEAIKGRLVYAYSNHPVIELAAQSLGLICISLLSCWVLYMFWQSSKKTDGSVVPTE